ncbi:MAG: pyridoxal phosphate-dependent aminotransferase [Candidatus Omnitrophota bacterium]|nr:pyridoxal phosphate-dependent aminotransferase [Candidatus Omnitrophota bacterium]
MRAQGQDILDLTESNPTRCGFNYSPSILSAFNVPDNLTYDPASQGVPKARQAVAGYYAAKGLSVNVDDIVLTSSTSEAYAFLLRLLLNPGEKALVPRPSYPLFQFLLELNDVAYTQYPLVYDGAWRLDQQALEDAVDEKTRAVILVNPNNPTGSYVQKDELDFLNGLCLRHSLSLISDEVFMDYGWGPRAGVTLMGNARVPTFVLGGLSKTLGLPQMKMSWLAMSGPRDTIATAMGRLEIIADTFLSVNTPVQNAAPVWLADAGGVRDQVLRRVKDNWFWLNAHVPAGVKVLSAQGGWYAVLAIEGLTDEEAFVTGLLKDERVLAHPGYFFDFEASGYVVVSLLPTAEIFCQAAGRLLRYVHEQKT